jgi:hypothetical protein
MIPSGPADRPQPLRLRPLQVSELLDETFRMYRDNFLLFAGVALTLAVPSLVASLLAGNYKTMGLFFTLFTNPSGFTRQVQFGPDINPVFLGLSYVVILLLLPFNAAANIQAGVHVASGRPTSVPAVLGRVLRRYLAVYGLLILVGLVAVLFITCVLIPLVVWILVQWSVAIPVMLVEGTGPAASLSRSRSLVRGHWWRLLGIFVVTSLLTAAVSTAVSALAAGLATLVPGLSADVRGAVLLTLVTLSSALIEPVFPIVVTLLYFDLRVRNEALDLDVLAQAAASPSMNAPGASGV